jgi:hypothetical protein
MKRSEVDVDSYPVAWGISLIEWGISKYNKNAHPKLRDVKWRMLGIFVQRVSWLLADISTGR